MFSILTNIVLIIFATHSSESLADTGGYLGGGVSHLEFDDDNSVNISITAGYNFKEWKFESSKINELTLGLETQYSDSISGADESNNYSVFATLRASFSDNWFFKVKQGITDFPDITLLDADAESSHFGAGIGLGYRKGSESIEIEYVYPNKTVHASLLEVSYKYHF